MDKKLTFTGGEPDINWDDLNRDERANRDALFAIFADFDYGPNVNFIISGCVATVTTGVNVSVTAGYIFLNGEILEVEAQVVANGGTLDLYKYVKEITYDSNGDKTFNDGTPRQTWQKNRGKVEAATAPILSTELDVVDGDRFRAGTWQTPSFVNSWGASPAGFQYRIGMGGSLEFRGGLNGSVATATTIFTLPTGYRPATQKNLSAILIDGADPRGRQNFDITIGGVVSSAFGGANIIDCELIQTSLD